LKSQLIANFGADLVFIRSQRRNEGEIVMSRINSEFANNFESASSSSSEASTDDYNFPKKSNNPDNIVDYGIMDIYYTSLLLRAALHDFSSSLIDLKISGDLSNIIDSNAKLFVPCLILYNVLAIITGCVAKSVVDDQAPDKHILYSTYLPLVDVDNDRVLNSISEDLIYLTSKRRKPSPKHIALSVVLRHLYGAKDFIVILNRLGYSISYDDVKRLEKGWASEEDNKCQTHRLRKKEPIIFVADNLDFNDCFNMLTKKLFAVC